MKSGLCSSPASERLFSSVDLKIARLRSTRPGGMVNTLNHTFCAQSTATPPQVGSCCADSASLLDGVRVGAPCPVAAMQVAWLSAKSSYCRNLVCAPVDREIPA